MEVGADGSLSVEVGCIDEDVATTKKACEDLHTLVTMGTHKVRCREQTGSTTERSCLRLDLWRSDLYLTTPLGPILHDATAVASLSLALGRWLG